MSTNSRLILDKCLKKSRLTVDILSRLTLLVCQLGTVDNFKSTFNSQLYADWKKVDYKPTNNHRVVWEFNKKLENSLNLFAIPLQFQCIALYFTFSRGARIIC